MGELIYKLVSDQYSMTLLTLVTPLVHVRRLRCFIETMRIHPAIVQPSIVDASLFASSCPRLLLVCSPFPPLAVPIVTHTPITSHQEESSSRSQKERYNK